MKKFKSIIPAVFFCLLFLSNMAYADTTDLTNAEPETTVVQMVNDENIPLSTIADLEEAKADESHQYHDEATAIINRLESKRSDAEELVNSYLRGRYSVPLEEVPGFIQEATVNLWLVGLYERRTRTNLPEEIRLLKKDTLSMLGQVQKGQIQITDKPVVDSGHFKSKATKKTFSDDYLRRYR